MYLDRLSGVRPPVDTVAGREHVARADECSGADEASRSPHLADTPPRVAAIVVDRSLVGRIHNRGLKALVVVEHRARYGGACALWQVRAGQPRWAVALEGACVVSAPLVSAPHVRSGSFETIEKTHLPLRRLFLLHQP